MSNCILLNYLFNYLITLLYHYTYTRYPILIYKCKLHFNTGKLSTL